MNRSCPGTWKAEVVTMRMMWAAGPGVLLETPFFENLDHRDQPPRGPDRLTK
jgi:hypothetical protein